MLQFLGWTFLIPFLTSVVLTPLIRRLAPSLRLVDEPGHRKVHHTPTPMGGGIAIFLGLAAVIIVTLIAGRAGGWAECRRAVTDVLSTSPETRRQFLGILAGGIILFATGLADDIWNLAWYLRLGIQLFVAVGVTASGVQATIFVSYPWVGFAVTVVWIIVLTNAMNFLDNMDALSAGIGLVASLMSASILLLLVRQPHWISAWALLALAGSLAGFLCWNRPPAAIFMGDSGSNLIGFLLATLTVAGTFYEQSGSRHVILAPLCILAVPLYDFCSVILIRLREGRSPFHGDKSHFSHRLVELGLRPAHAVLTIHLATLMTGLGALLLYKVQDWTGAMLVAALISSVLGIIAILETAARRERLPPGGRDRTTPSESVAKMLPAQSGADSADIEAAISATAGVNATETAE